MATNRKTYTIGGATFILALVILYASFNSASAKTDHPNAVITTASPAAIAQGIALISAYHCSSCHGADLEGHNDFPPSIRRTGSMHDYTSAMFVTLMHTGMKNDSKMARAPMPKYPKMTSAQAITIYRYLCSLR